MITIALLTLYAGLAQGDKCDGVTAESMAGKSFTIRAESQQTGDTYDYTVKVGPGGYLMQKEVHTLMRESFELGTHAGYSGMVENFSNGDFCQPIGRGRRAKITFKFGSETKILSSSEPSICYYEFTIQIDDAICAEVATPKPDCRDLGEAGQWKDSAGTSCSGYESRHLCTETGGYGSGWRSDLWDVFGKWSVDGKDATAACCACGGGIHTEDGPECNAPDKIICGVCKKAGGACLEQTSKDTCLKFFNAKSKAATDVEKVCGWSVPDFEKASNKKDKYFGGLSRKACRSMPWAKRTRNMEMKFGDFGACQAEIAKDHKPLTPAPTAIECSDFNGDKKGCKANPLATNGDQCGWNRKNDMCEAYLCSQMPKRAIKCERKAKKLGITCYYNPSSESCVRAHPGLECPSYEGKNVRKYCRKLAKMHGVENCFYDKKFKKGGACLTLE